MVYKYIIRCARTLLMVTVAPQLCTTMHLTTSNTHRTLLEQVRKDALYR